MQQMTSRERVQTAFAHREPDKPPRRAPGLAPALCQRLIAETGATDVAAFFRSDFRAIAYRPPDALPDFARYYQRVETPHYFEYGSEYQAEWGVATVPAGYYHFGGPLFPMRNLSSLAELDAYPFPDYVRDWGHDHFEAEVTRLHDQGYYVCGPVNRTFQTAWMLTGREKLFQDAAFNAPFVDALFERIYQVNERMAERCAQAGVDAIAFGDDIGMQDRLMISPEWYRTWIKPGHARLIAAARAVNPDIQVMFHSDGDIHQVITDLIEVGVTVLTTVQPESMDPLEIKRRYGAHLSLGGTFGVQSLLPFGTPDEIRAEVRRQAAVMGVGGGFFVSPANTCEPEVPVANVIALYDAVDALACDSSEKSIR